MGLAVLHPAGYVLATAISDPSAAGERLLGLFISPRLRTGVLALLILSVLTLYATLRTSPKVRYEIWRATHGLLAVMAAALMLHHAMIAGAYSREWLVLATWGALATAALVAVLLVYVVRPRRLRQETWALVEVVPDGTGAWELTLRGPSSTRLRFRGGQFVWLSLAVRTMPWYDHPFSIASAPAQLPDLRLLIREAGDFTSHVGALPTGTLFVLDGPHGSFVLEDGEGTVVMIAGGVGIAPILGMLEEAANAGVRRRFHLLYAGRTPAGLAGLQRLKALKERLDLEIGLFVDDPGTPPAAGFA